MKVIYQISATEVDKVKRSECWSFESMEGHGAEGRKVEYIGSDIPATEGRVNHYYRDSEGAYWYETGWRESDGRIVSMDVHIFGREIKRSRRKTPRPGACNANS